MAFVPFLLSRRFRVDHVQDRSGFVKAFRDEPSLETSKRRMRKVGMVYCNTSDDCKKNEVCLDMDSGKFGICVRESFFE